MKFHTLELSCIQVHLCTQFFWKNLTDMSNMTFWHLRMVFNLKNWRVQVPEYTSVDELNSMLRQWIGFYSTKLYDTYFHGKVISLWRVMTSSAKNRTQEEDQSAQYVGICKISQLLSEKSSKYQITNDGDFSAFSKNAFRKKVEISQNLKYWIICWTWW